jgi:hypothetical protein
VANVYKTVNGKILLTAPGSGKIANECCCKADCTPCCEDPWLFCVKVNDGTNYAYADVSIDTALSDCCCGGSVAATLKRSDTGATVGTLYMSLLVAHDGCFAAFAIDSAYFATCSSYPPGCPSAWVKGTLTGTVPDDCKLSFAATIARNGTTPLNIAAEEWPCTFEYEKCVENLIMLTYEYEQCTRPE